MFARPFALLRVLSVIQEAEPGESLDRPRRGLTAVETAAALNEEARREGFPSWQHFLLAWREMHGAAAMEEPCWRIEFCVEEAYR